MRGNGFIGRMACLAAIACVAATGSTRAIAEPTLAARAEGYVGYVNLSAEIFGQQVEEHAFQGGGSGSLSLAISEFYIQGDVFGDATEFDDLESEIIGGGGHLGWRDAALGAAGAVGTFNQQYPDPGASTDQWRSGFEGELFLERVSLAANVGYAESETSDNNSSSVYVDGALAYYPVERVRLHAMGGAFAVEEDEPVGIVGASAEFLALDPLGLFVRWEAAIIDDDAFEVQQHSLVVGARLYWGSSGPSLVAYDRAHFKPSCFGYQLGGARLC